ncbi:acyl carrier protein [Streptantibioticus cattleyicolor]|uniref:Carrier domain-containing protein n=1 Tax=Streptantibioticus cattleyicolor (strain ATCC 35852 / DSM 46488 / JCM 4925 / NBRC 14057 / NRRL 8057) TaxID=1003195 RepID=F8JKR3_STREN|nr:acyl carrier protein [Streptantibioticus cattleyicolor]AEW98445.1 hypothetical protein SCATT_p02520 [Streptantibioticus cattleyicolor NRRL 8057 = DSM 46488]CCB72501.1 protein of unknown function [Streptantibioticus cattleyicolor NRRL 8057 = DSM 46488]
MTTQQTPALETVTEHLLGIFRQALDFDGAGPDDALPDLGGESMTIIKIAVAIEEGYGAEVPLELFLQRPTARQVAEAVLAAQPQEAR